jgi:ATP-dependent DNA helicase DinG
MDLVYEAYKDGGLLETRFPNYQPRPQQKEFAEAIQKSIREQKPFVGEAPTGVGKSLAALIPAVEVVLNEDAKIAIVTSSIILQEQYVTKDIPSLCHLLGRPLSFTSIKGRSNYVCQLKAQEQEISGDIFEKSSDEYRNVFEFATTSKTGDFSELGFVPSMQTYSKFAAVDEHECTGKLCPAYSTCHYYRERKKAMVSQIIVCNYHFFFTAQKSNQMLPDDIRVVVMDEGHEMGDIALNFLERKYSKFSWRNINTFLQKTSKALPAYKQNIVEAFKISVNVNEIVFTQESVLDLLTQTFRQNQENKMYWSLTIAERRELSDLAHSHYQTLIHRKDALSDYLEQHGLPTEEVSAWYEMYSDEEIGWQHALQKLEETLSNTIYFLRDFFLFDEEEALEEGKRIYWLQNDANHGVSLHTKPPTPSSFTETFMDANTAGFTPILMSATMSANKRFDFVTNELGMPNERNECIVSSPFNLEHNLLWYLPAECPAGNDPAHYTVVINEMQYIVERLQGRTLCLFTSNHSLQNATRDLRNRLPKQIKILSQHETPKRIMIQELRNNPNTVLLGTRSFFTGVDIQGQNLSAVLIDKIPFPMIGDPVNDWLMNQPNGFRTFTLPTAIVTMKQGIGRLNRTANDKGLISVLDGRLRTSSYRNNIFNSFDFKIQGTSDLKKVSEYIENELYFGGNT